MVAVAGRLEANGRPLYAAHAALPVPDAPHLALWHACTLLREHRFDSHIATLIVSGVDGLDSLVIANAAGSGMDPATIQRMRGWTEEETGAAAERLRRRGILDRDNALTVEGRALKGCDRGHDRQSCVGRVGAAGGAGAAAFVQRRCSGCRRCSRIPPGSCIRTRSESRDPSEVVPRALLERRHREALAQRVLDPFAALVAAHGSGEKCDRVAAVSRAGPAVAAAETAHAVSLVVDAEAESPGVRHGRRLGRCRSTVSRPPRAGGPVRAVRP